MARTKSLGSKRRKAESEYYAVVRFIFEDDDTGFRNIESVPKGFYATLGQAYAAAIQFQVSTLEKIASSRKPDCDDKGDHGDGDGDEEEDRYDSSKELVKDVREAVCAGGLALKDAYQKMMELIDASNFFETTHRVIYHVMPAAAPIVDDEDEPDDDLSQLLKDLDEDADSSFELDDLRDAFCC
ncbi:hypothetical protein SELMODRAFT_427439 [Selaginella moellendorffii]|uniref:Uncharacterized protein n=1 Tax=Selaginella moellendorffii TaxID=88036 RepID=D8SZM4_SELML|nr:hypothetical protein SELMODRAFT_427439 [Selaginella moellendorffii]